MCTSISNQLTGSSMLWLSSGMGGLMGLGRLEMYQAAPAATAAKAARVAGSDRKFTRALLPSAILLSGLAAPKATRLGEDDDYAHAYYGHMT